MHNSITAWVEVRNLVCLCNILFAEFQFTELCICANFLTLGMRCPLGFRLNTGITGVEDRVAENILDTCCLAACVGVTR